MQQNACCAICRRGVGAKFEKCWLCHAYQGNCNKLQFSARYQPQLRRSRATTRKMKVEKQADRNEGPGA